MLKPVFSNSSSWRVCRVGEDGGSSSFLTRSSYVYSFSSRVGNLASTSKSRSFLGSTVGYHGWLGISFSVSHSCQWYFNVKKSLSDRLPGKMGFVFCLENQRNLLWTLAFLWWNVGSLTKLIEESALESSASLYPLPKSFSMKKIFLLDKCVTIVVVSLHLADDLSSKETVENGLWVAWRSVQKMHSLCFVCVTFDV